MGVPKNKMSRIAAVVAGVMLFILSFGVPPADWRIASDTWSDMK